MFMIYTDASHADDARVRPAGASLILDAGAAGRVSRPPVHVNRGHTPALPPFRRLEQLPARALAPAIAKPPPQGDDERPGTQNFRRPRLRRVEELVAEDGAVDQHDVGAPPLRAVKKVPAVQLHFRRTSGAQHRRQLRVVQSPDLGRELVQSAKFFHPDASRNVRAQTRGGEERPAHAAAEVRDDRAGRYLIRILAEERHQGHEAELAVHEVPHVFRR
mmetsp:Transcript_1318/g.4978  ORF Transcript_1318/g.4978 Transcript_1318/m.4978 type:complete len:218 (-) Transcript_1318:328-981(-)